MPPGWMLSKRPDGTPFTSRQDFLDDTTMRVLTGQSGTQRALNPSFLQRGRPGQWGAPVPEAEKMRILDEVKGRMAATTAPTDTALGSITMVPNESGTFVPAGALTQQQWVDRWGSGKGSEWMPWKQHMLGQGINRYNQYLDAFNAGTFVPFEPPVATPETPPPDSTTPPPDAVTPPPDATTPPPDATTGDGSTFNIPDDVYPYGGSQSQSASASYSGVDMNNPFIKALMEPLIGSAENLMSIAEGIPGIVGDRYNNLVRTALGPEAFQGTLNNLAARGMLDSTVASDALGRTATGLIQPLLDKGYQSILASELAKMEVPSALTSVLSNLGRVSRGVSEGGSRSFNADPSVPYRTMANILLAQMGM